SSLPKKLDGSCKGAKKRAKLAKVFKLSIQLSLSSNSLAAASSTRKFKLPFEGCTKRAGYSRGSASSDNTARKATLFFSPATRKIAFAARFISGTVKVKR